MSIAAFPIQTKLAAKADVGLGAVDNTADADKPVSTAQAAALALKADASSLTALQALSGKAPFNSQVADYTAQVSDVGKRIGMNAAGVSTLSLPDNTQVAIPVDAWFYVTAGTGSACTIAPSGTATVLTESGLSLSPLVVNAVYLVIKSSTNGWRVSKVGGTSIVDDFTTGGADAALSAERGKDLNASKIALCVGVPTGGVDGEVRQRIDSPFCGLLYQNSGGTWAPIGYGSTGGNLFSSGDGDITAVTYDGSGRVATYTRNGTTWTLAYGPNGPASETAGSLVKTYNYDANGFFTGISGAVNAGQTPSGTWANRPASAKLGDRYFVTDIGVNGVMCQWTAAGRWMPMGNFMVASAQSLVAAPLFPAVASPGTQLITTSPIVLFPANFLGSGMRFRLTWHITRSGVAANVNINTRLGTANANSDSAISIIGLAASTNNWERMQVEFTFVGTTLASTGSLGINANSPSSPIEVTGYNFANAYYLNLACGAVTSPDTVTLLGYWLEFLG